MAYSFVAGLSVTRLVNMSPYVVRVEAAVFAAIGLLFYTSLMALP